MKPIVNVDIVSDVVCPWCVIGYGRLKKAIANNAPQLDVKITWHPFELNPDMPIEGENLRTHLAQKYGTSLEDSIRARAMLTEEGRKVGFTFRYFDEMKMLNTHQCHQLLHWAKDSGLQNQLAEALFEHFFSNHGTFSKEELVNVAEKVGLNAQQARSFLENDTFSEAVRLSEQIWHQQGIRGVPLFIFNGEQSLSGAQNVETFGQLLNQLSK